MSRTPHAWISNLCRALTMLVVAGFAASALAACGGDSGSGGSSAAVAASAAIASAMAGSGAATSDASSPAPAAASTTASSGGDSSQDGFTDAQACTWAKQELVALRKVGNNPDIAQVNILTSLQDFFDQHGGFSDEIKQGSEITEATQRACPTQHDELLKQADLKSLGDLP